MSQPGQTKSKELKLTSKQVFTPDSLKDDKRKIKLLYLIKTLNGASEKALTIGLYELKQKGLDLGYQFNVIGNNVFSPMIKEDITALLYVGYIENDPQSKKLKLTSSGQEFLDKQQIEDDFKNNLAQLLSDIKMKINAIDEENRLKNKRR
ncbi:MULTISPECIES: hypothetical protein [Sulfurisphaera]|uniref:Uncharacterized protein n=3 Tax=Sulfurisphaera TaxID=69655 RepID=Q976E7_SULTO|nr:MULTISPECIES: hypothetical protein [Sulfurisphaera]MBB5253218.1 hypothetical protein [Sulfurisphaera ohwakuensis]QGR15873.1 hypothetical protein D1869_00700 [Sulfurisphaera ohwakuensis]BAB65200.1 hypothetical protein STK_02390 [Sulfurisphaera tokodaii str. 7]HII74360.1 hypothetical protein [Sulfurisphaera tokodaii]